MVTNPESPVKDSFRDLSQAANLLNRLVIIAKQAQQKILSVYEAPSGGWELEFKADNSPLTIADRLSNEIICAGLKELDEKIPVISEENKMIPYEKRKEFEYYWLVDPLDGTKEFIKRNGEFTINIALIHKSKVVLGLVGIPCQDKIYYAMKGQGAFRSEHNQAAVRLNAAEYDPDSNELTIAITRSHLNSETLDFINRFPQAKTIVAGSSLKFMLIAEGKVQLYPRFGRTMEWDVAASQIIVEEAGGKVLHSVNCEPLEYNKKDLSIEGFVVYGKMNEARSQTNFI